MTALDTVGSGSCTETRCAKGFYGELEEADKTDQERAQALREQALALKVLLIVSGGNVNEGQNEERKVA